MTFLAMTLSVERREQPGISVICNRNASAKGSDRQFEIEDWHVSWWLQW